MTNGIYWTPTKTIWCFADEAADPPEPDPITIHHEATHQLFTEGRADAEKARATLKSGSDDTSAADTGGR